MLQLDVSETFKNEDKIKLISIINVYGPTSQKVEKDPDELDSFYKSLNETINCVGKNTILILAGDFNAKIGQKQKTDTCIGSFSKGKRNNNGEKLLELCEDRDYFITNSAFNHPSRHITTWTGQFKDKDTGKVVSIFNQIDFIICQKRHKHLLTNARSYAGTLTNSDHRLVKSTFKFEKGKLWHTKKNTPKTPKINLANLTSSKVCLDQYKTGLNERLITIEQDNNNSTVSDPWTNVQQAIKESAKASAGVNTCNKQKRTANDTISELSNRQKDLRLQIQNTDNEERKIKLRNERNRVLHTIRKTILEQRNEELEKKVQKINEANSDNAMFKAVKLLNQKHYENPSVEDSSGKLVINPNQTLEIVADFFKEKFQNKDLASIASFQGIPRKLNKPFTSEEVRKSLESLKNNRAPGGDEISGELLKYGTPLLHKSIANILNGVFEEHETININSGELIAIPKPGKPKGPPKNLRPITLLNTIRKALSIITLHRIRPNIEEYLSHSQSGFRPERSTSDVAWTHKWLAAKAKKEDVEIKITGIDMSAAFDTIDRQILLDIIERIVEEDELRIIRFLLSDTVINTRINGATKERPFVSNIGTPQGDSLSPVLFSVYLENALKEVRTILPRPTNKLEKTLPTEIAYADDVDFVGLNFVDTEEVQNTLHKYNLLVNIDKTEFTTLSRAGTEYKNTKKVGTLIGDEEDVERRKRLSNAALTKLLNVWIKGDKIKRKTKLKLYRSLVKSILVYNCGTWALTKSEEEKLNAFHRKQLRKVLNIKYPVKITNSSLYNKCEEHPLSIYILENRWRLFGHILRRNIEIPANKSMNSYFATHGKKFRGRPLTTLPVVLNKDLSRLQENTLQLTTREDLEHLRCIARSRQQWRELSTRIRKAAEAPPSDD